MEINNEYLLYEFFKIESDGSTSLFNALNVISRNGITVDLLQDEQHNLYYEMDVKDVLKSDIESDDILYIRNGGWELSENKKKIVKFL